MFIKSRAFCYSDRIPALHQFWLLLFLLSFVFSYQSKKKVRLWFLNPVILIRYGSTGLFGARLWGQLILEPKAEQIIFSLLFWGSEMFSCVCSLVRGQEQRHKGSNTKWKGVLTVLLARARVEISESSQAKLFWEFHTKPARSRLLHKKKKNF